MKKNEQKIIQIKEFSEKTGLTPYTIRFYEKKELFRVKRDEKNRRIYDETDIEWIKMLKRLKDMGMKLSEIKKYSDLRYEGNGTIKERMKILTNHKKYVNIEIEKWQKYLQNLDDKLEIYESFLKSISEKQKGHKYIKIKEKICLQIQI